METTIIVQFVAGGAISASQYNLMAYQSERTFARVEFRSKDSLLAVLTKVIPELDATRLSLLFPDTTHIVFRGEFLLSDQQLADLGLHEKA